MKPLFVLLFTLCSFSVNAQVALSQSFKDSVIVEFTKLVNNHRRYSANIFVKLENNIEYNKSCDLHSEYQLEIGKLTHKRKPGTVLNHDVMGENCAAIYVDYECPSQLAKEIFNIWKTSPAGHNYTMIRGGIEFFGLGLAKGSSGNVFATMRVGSY